MSTSTPFACPPRAANSHSISLALHLPQTGCCKSHLDLDATQCLHDLRLVGGAASEEQRFECRTSDDSGWGQQLRHAPLGSTIDALVLKSWEQFGHVNELSSGAMAAGMKMHNGVKVHEFQGTGSPSRSSRRRSFVTPREQGEGEAKCTKIRVPIKRGVAQRLFRCKTLPAPDLRFVSIPTWPAFLQRSH